MKKLVRKNIEDYRKLTGETKLVEEEKAVSKKKIKKIATRVNTEEMDIAVFNIPNEIPALDAQLTQISTEIDRLNSAIQKKQELLKSESAKLEKAKKAFEEAKKQLAIV